MLLAQKLGGFTPAESDKLRKTLVKKSLDTMGKKGDEREAARVKFVTGAKEINGVPEHVSQELWERIEFFSVYGFNKSHAIAYALDSYYAAWLHTYYETDWLGTILESENNNPDALAKAIGSMMSNGGEIGDLLGTMGFKVDVEPKTVTVDAPTPNENNDSETEQELVADVHIWNSTMHITIDLTHNNVEDDNLDLTLTDSGTILQIIKGNQLRPFRKIELERVVKDVVSWDLNNGILDIELSIDGNDGNIEIE